MVSGPSQFLGVDAAFIVETTHEAFIAMDADGRVREWNGAAADTFGWSRDEVVGRELAELIIPEALRELHRDGLRHFLATGDGPVLDTRLELPAVRRDGTQVDVEITISAPQLEGRPFFHAFLRDISERKRSERLLKMQLSVTEALATAAPEDLPVRVLEALCRGGGWRYGGWWLVSSEVDVLHGYRAWWPEGDDCREFENASRAMSFYRGQGLPGAAWSRGGPVVAQDLANRMKYPRSAIAERTGMGPGLAVPVRSGDDIVGVLEFFARGAEVADPHMVQMLRTITPLIGERIARLRAERRASDLKDAFVATVSHELRTPLTSIVGFAHTALQTWDDLDPERHREFLHIILQQGSRLSRLVDDLLQMSRIQVGALRPRLAPVDLESTVHETLAELGEATVQVLADGDIPEAIVDRDMFKQVVVNYLSNARRYGADPIRVELDRDDEDGLVTLAVCDAGPGVPPPFRRRLFEKFARADNVHDVPGTGLGLAIVQSLAHMLGGDAWYEETEGGGSRFVASFPQAGATDAQRAV